MGMPPPGGRQIRIPWASTGPAHLGEPGGGIIPEPVLPSAKVQIFFSRAIAEEVQRNPEEGAYLLKSTSRINKFKHKCINRN